jgi:diguanylate cyclase (GGDEF)-like protein
MVMSTPENGAAREALRALRRSQDEPYAGADRINAGRIVALLWLLTGVLTLAFLPFDPPTEMIGAAGWVGAGVVVAASLLGARHLLRRDPPLGFDRLLGLSYLGLAQVLCLEWLAGGTSTPYQNLYLLWLGSAMGIHPPRRALTFLAVTALAAFAPLLYEGWSSSVASDIATAFMLWAALGVIVLALMLVVRAQRVELRAGEEHARELARADPLTGLGNRRAFDEALVAEMARARRADSTVSVALIDIDGFKDLNDRFGHLEGDRGLREVGAAITGAMRGGDRGFRWGGDELAVILPDTGFEGAQLALTRIASGVSGSCTTPDGRPVTVSWGVAEATGEMEAADLLDQADLALMARKRAKLAPDRPTLLPDA